MTNPVEIILLYAVIPVWLLAGLADWWCHRKANISHTSGIKESFIHLLMFMQGALALIAGLFLEINALVLAFLFFLLVIHEITAIWDLEYANPLREITPTEQHIHSFLEAIPFMAIAAVCALHWDQFIMLVTFNGLADFTLELKKQPLPHLYIGLVMLAAVLFDLLVYAEEFYRCLKVQNYGKHIKYNV